MKRTRTRQRYPRRGWGPWRRDWYSICSMHYFYEPECRLCTNGIWKNAWRTFCGQVVFKAFPDLWRWWANRGRPRMRP